MILWVWRLLRSTDVTSKGTEESIYLVSKTLHQHVRADFCYLYLVRFGNSHSFPTCKKGNNAFFWPRNPSQIPIGHYRISEVKELLQCFCWQERFMECCTLLWLCNINRNGSCHHVLMGNNLWLQTLFSSPDDQIWQSFSETHGASLNHVRIQPCV